MRPAIAVATATWLVAGLLTACVTPPPPPPPKPLGPTLSEKNEMLQVEVEEKTRELMDASDRLASLQDDIEEQRRRLQLICVDYPDHQVCDLHSAARYARDAFCADAEFTEHIDGVVKACHQGQCKQVDEANLLTRTNYMRLVQRLPHALVLFRAYDIKLDRKDRSQLQKFIEQIDAARGYLIVVGRASRDGSWKENLRLALDRAETARKYLVEDLGMDESRVGYITYGHAKMYITETDATRLSERKLTTKQANRSALVFAYPCYDGEQYEF